MKLAARVAVDDEYAEDKYFIISLRTLLMKGPEYEETRAQNREELKRYLTGRLGIASEQLPVWLRQLLVNEADKGKDFKEMFRLVGRGGKKSSKSKNRNEASNSYSASEEQ